MGPMSSKNHSVGGAKSHMSVAPSLPRRARTLSQACPCARMEWNTNAGFCQERYSFRHSPELVNAIHPVIHNSSIAIQTRTGCTGVGEVCVCGQDILLICTLKKPTPTPCCTCDCLSGDVMRRSVTHTPYYLRNVYI